MDLDRLHLDRRRLVLVIIGTIVVAAIGLGLGRAIGRTSSPGSDATPDATTPIATEPSTPPTTDAVVFPVATTTVTIVDSTRPVQSGGATLADHRELPTTVWAPTGTGRYPLIVFAHGYDAGPLDHARFCEQLAASGFVVAAPSFPLADPSRGFGLDREDISQEALDIVLIAHQMRVGVLSARITSGPVGVVGHSDGADAALLVAERPTIVDPLIGAVVAIAPDAIVGPLTDVAPPLLLIHGTADEVVPYSRSTQVFASISGARWFLTLDGGDHQTPILGGSPWTPVLDASVTDFLRAALAVQPMPASAFAAVTTSLDALDLSSAEFAD